MFDQIQRLQSKYVSKYNIFPEFIFIGNNDYRKLIIAAQHHTDKWSSKDDITVLGMKLIAVKEENFLKVGNVL